MSNDDSRALEAVAVIGMAGRFPGAPDVARFWANQLAGIASIRRFSDEELTASGVPAELSRRPDYVAMRGTVDDPELFDADFFGLTPREAEVMDPQNRLFLETCWQALEDAGYDPKTYPGRAGIYAGANLSTYLLSNLMSRGDLIEQIGPLQLRIGNEKDSLTTWVSYKLDLRGPAVSVQSACSTSLVAVHLASQALLDGECDLTLAGGVGLAFPLRVGYVWQEGGILSKDGACRPFDADATGTAPGTGIGVVVLRRLSDALADGDPIRAVIRATAVCNDGARKAGYTAPGVEGQLRAVAEALALAEVPAATVGYVETHGSGTALGDPIEIQALTRAFRAQTDATGFCALGAVKAAVGHLDSAAGVTGLIKTVCALESGKIPPLVNFQQANPALELETSPFYAPTAARDWPVLADADGPAPRRAGVSSFGIGGTNVHAVLEQAPAQEPAGPSRPWQQLLLSARSETALEQAAANLAACLRDGSVDLADVAYTLKVGRHGFRHRLAVVCRDREEAAALLEGGTPARRLRGSAPAGEAAAPGVAFLFPGLGDHAPGMARELYRGEPVFRQVVDECAERLRPHLGLDLRTVIYPHGTEGEAPAASAEPDFRSLLRRSAAPESEEERRLNDTRLAQPAVFVIELALARLLESWGLVPRAMIGYSLGEYVGATLAGVFSLETALELVAERARRIGELPAGAMLAVPLPEAEVRAKLVGESELSISAANGESLTVVGGPPAAVSAFGDRLEAAGVACRELRTTHAFHTAMMEPLREAFARRVARATLSPPRIPFLSNVTGTWIRPEEATDPAYWARHLVETVRFTDGLAQLLAGGDLALLEVGPGQTLTTLARQQARGELPVVPALPDRREGGSELAYLLGAVARLWTAGVEIDWAGFYQGERRRRVPLPTYPFERKRFWVEPGSGSVAMPAALPESKAADLADWFYLPSWRRTAPARLGAAGAPAEGAWLVFLDRCGVGEALVEQLRAAGREVAAVAPGESADFDTLTRFIVDLRNLSNESDWAPADLRARRDELLETAFYAPIELAQALGQRFLTAPIELALVSSQVQEVTGGETLCPLKAALLGPSAVIAQEYPQVACRAIDVDLSATDPARLAADLIAELSAPRAARVVAYRGRHRWARMLEPVRLTTSETPRLRAGGVYLLTGGASETNVMLAEHLAEKYSARLALLVPPGFTEQPARLDALVIPAVLDDPASMRAAVAVVRERLGALHGVFHTATMGDAGLIQLKTRAAAEEVLAPKIAGTLALDAALEGEPLDFLALFSATAALTGGIGQVSFCAANAFLDAFALWRTARGLPTVAIGWDTFRWETHDTPGAAPLPEEMARQLQHNLETFGIEAGEATAALERVLASGLPRVAVSARPLPAVLAGFEKLAGESLIGTLGPAAAHSRPQLATAFREPATETETTLARMWQEAFGVDRVGVDDNFFELDGNSLMAIQIVTRLRSAFGVDLPMSALFEAPTVALLGAQIDGLLATARGEQAEVDALLAEIEGLSAEEAELLLQQEGAT